MSALSSKLRSAEGGRLHFWCPGCNEMHGIQVGDGPGPRWTWNGDAERPTFSPSVLVTAPGLQPERCHFFVRDGHIQFLHDCDHALKGQTVELPDWTEVDS